MKHQILSLCSKNLSVLGKRKKFCIYTHMICNLHPEVSSSFRKTIKNIFSF